MWLKSFQRNLGVVLISHDLKPSTPPTEPTLKATALISPWIKCSPKQRPSDEDVAHFAPLSNLAPTEIDKIFLKTWAENAVKDSQAAAEHVTDYAKPLVPDLFVFAWAKRTLCKPWCPSSCWRMGQPANLHLQAPKRGFCNR